MVSSLEKTLRSRKQLYYSYTDLSILIGGTPDSVDGVIRRGIDSGVIIRIKRGLYCVGSDLAHRKPHSFELAQLIYGPSFISLESALSYHGLIPEAVYTVTSVTINRSKNFETPLGHYHFDKVPTQNLLIGVERVVMEDMVFFIANPWRALADYVYCYKKIWTSLDELGDDLRLNTEDLPKPSTRMLDDMIKYYNSKRVTNFFRNILKGA